MGTPQLLYMCETQENMNKHTRSSKWQQVGEVPLAFRSCEDLAARRIGNVVFWSHGDVMGRAASVQDDPQLGSHPSCHRSCHRMAWLFTTNLLVYEMIGYLPSNGWCFVHL